MKNRPLFPLESRERLASRGQLATRHRLARRVATLVAYSLLVACHGCGPEGPDVVKVHGQITQGGQPVSNVVIQFYPERGRPSAGRTDDEGRFAPEFSQGISHGVMPGQNKVSIQVVQDRIDEAVNLQDSKYHPRTSEIVKIFGSWNETPLEIEVTHDSPEINIELDDYWPQ